MLALGTDLHLDTLGQGEPILFVHASFGDRDDWLLQHPLADRYQLRLLDRRGHGLSPARITSAATDPAEFNRQAAGIAHLCGDGAHLVGHSYGGLLALLAAAQRPAAIRSLTVIEPPAYGVARGHPDVDAVVARLAAAYAAIPGLTPEGFRAQAFAALGFYVPPQPLAPRGRKNVVGTMTEPPGWLADVPLAALAAHACSRFPALIVSGDWGGPSTSPRDTAGRACTHVCTVLAGVLRAEHAVIAGGGHAVQFTGRPFNERLARFLASAG